MAVSGAINRQKVAISRAINSHFLTFYGAINSQKGRQILYPNNSEPNNVISNLDLISAMTPLPQSSTTLLPTSATPTPVGCVSPRPASTTLQASTTTVHYDKRLLVPDLLTTVQRDQPQDPMPGPSNFTTSNSLPSVNHVVGVNKNQTGRGKGHEVTDCSLSSVAGHQQPESATSTVSLYVTPIV